MEYKYTGIILNKRDIGETDRIYTMYTLEGGKIRSIAKGVRRPHAKLAASLENITYADITIVRTRGFGKITGSIVEQNFSAIKKDCEALLNIFEAIGIFDKIIDCENPDKDVFILLREYLESMNECALQNSADKYLMLKLGFLVKLLNLLGYTIEVKVCVLCGKKLSEGGLYFSPQQGGVLCNQCGKGAYGTRTIKANAVKMIRLFLGNSLAALSKLKAQQRDCDSVHIAIDDFLKWNT